MTAGLAFGAMPLANGKGASIGCDRLEPPPRHARHELLADGGVRIVLPRDGVLSDVDARRLAWALLNDLAPDEVIPTPDVVTYREAQRLAVLRAVAAGHHKAAEIAAALEWRLRVAQRRAEELADDGRLVRSRRGRGRTSGFLYHLPKEKLMAGVRHQDPVIDAQRAFEDEQRRSGAMRNALLRTLARSPTRARRRPGGWGTVALTVLAGGLAGLAVINFAIRLIEEIA